MRRLPWWWLLVGCALASCGKAHPPTGPSVDSETHFLSLCTQSCGDGLSCVCGVCTTSCAADRDCRELSEGARCVEPSPREAQSCALDAPALACDMSCERDADCAALSERHVCDRGSCRKPAPASDKPTELPFARGGRRLNALHYVADGLEQFRNLYDGELGFVCEFAPGEKGSGVHCVPSKLRQVIYLDSNCQQPATPIDAGDESNPGSMPGDWFSALVTEPASSCLGAPAERRVSYRIGERVFEGGVGSIGVTPPTVFALHDANCAETPLQTRLLLPSVHRIELQDPSQLVAGEVATIEVEGGLSVRRVLADDDTQITVDILGLGGTRCMLLSSGVCTPGPTTIESGGFFLDDQCLQLAFSSSTFASCADPSFGVRPVDDDAHVYELTPARTVFTKNVINPDRLPGSDFEYSCDPVAVDMLETKFASKVWMPGKDVTTTLPSASSLETGGGSLHLKRFVAMTPNRDTDHFVALDGGGPLLDARGHTCQIQEAVDGTLLCLADSDQVTQTDYWKDAGCNERLYAGLDPAADPSELRLPRMVGDRSPLKLEALMSLRPYDGPTFQVAQTDCVPAIEAPTTPLLAQDADVPLTSLPSVESAEL
jgi:hypothetical protein